MKGGGADGGGADGGSADGVCDNSSDGGNNSVASGGDDGVGGGDDGVSGDLGETSTSSETVVEMRNVLRVSSILLYCSSLYFVLFCFDSEKCIMCPKPVLWVYIFYPSVGYQH